MAYIGSTPVPQGIKETQSFTATAGQTTFNTLGYSNGNNISVFLNGVRLINGTDYTATNGSDIVLTAAASASDVLEFETFNEFNLVNQNLTTPTFTDTVVVSGDTTASLTLKNNTHEDTDGGRESTLIFQGEQSGGEISTLAEIEASHDGTADDQKGDLIFKTNDGSDNAAPTERMRVDSSGNLLVGTTDDSVYNNNGSGTGINLQNFGNIAIARDGNDCLALNRLTSDGAIANFNKDGTTVGSIGTSGGDLLIHSTAANHGGLRFGEGYVFPVTNSGATSDGGFDLGLSVGRWKDLYLSGGAYIGGTTSANYLDDYERGLHTISINQGGIGFNSLYQNFQYIKIGDFVNVHGLLLVSSGGDTNDLRVNMPFTAKTGLNQTADATHGLVSSYGVPTGSGGIRCTISKGTNKLRFVKTVDNAVWTSLLGNELANGDHLYVNISYEVA